ncbi:hypothetical protein P4234_25815 [Pseudomonas aeruginosa]|nr:hypothetical protein [Pseudomonas aeruginosa]
MRVAAGCGALADHWHGVAPVAGPVYRCVMRAGGVAGSTPSSATRPPAARDSTRVLDVERELGWDRTLRPRDRRLSLIYNPRPSPKDDGRPPGWRRSAEFDRFRDALSERRASLYIPTGLLDFNFGPTRYTPANTPDVFFDFRYVAPVRGIRPVDAGRAAATAVLPASMRCGGFPGYGGGRPIRCRRALSTPTIRGRWYR